MVQISKMKPETEKAILDALKDEGNLTLGAIHNQTGIDKSFLWQCLMLLIEQGKVEKVDRGLYSLKK